MPVENADLIFPKPEQRVEQIEGPFTVEADHGAVKDKDMVDLSDPETVDHSDLHTPHGTGFAEVPGPYTVVLDGYGQKRDGSSAQIKLVEAEPRGKGKGTSGAESK